MPLCKCREKFGPEILPNRLMVEPSINVTTGDSRLDQAFSKAKLIPFKGGSIKEFDQLCVWMGLHERMDTSSSKIPDLPQKLRNLKNARDMTSIMLHLLVERRAPGMRALYDHKQNLQVIMETGRARSERIRENSQAHIDNRVHEQFETVAMLLGLLLSSPANVLDNTITDGSVTYERFNKAGSHALAWAVAESMTSSAEGRLTLKSLVGAQEFYLKNGFVWTFGTEYQGVMILWEEAAKKLLESIINLHSREQE